MHILQAVMLRRLLACLALITGLAAVGAPASAMLGEALCCETSVSGGATETRTEQHGDCPERQRAMRADAAAAPEKPATRANRLIHRPVLFGVDRAYE